MKQPARRMGRLAIRLVLLALGTVVGLAALLVWRLSRGPIDLAVLTPYVEAALSSPDGARTVHARTTQLGWDGARRHVMLRVYDVEVRGRSGDAIASVPALAIRLGVRALLRGAIVPREIALLGPRVQLVRQPDGHIDLGLGLGARPAAGGPPLAPLPLYAVEVTDGEITLVDQGSGLTWRIAGVALGLWPEGPGLAGRLSGTLEVGTVRVPVTIDAEYRSPADGVHATVSFSGFDPSALATAPGVGGALPTGASALAAGLQLPLDGTLRLALDGALVPVHARLEVAGGRGALAAPGLPGGSIAVEHVDAALEIDPAADALRLDDLTLELGGPTVHVRGRLAGLRGTGTIDAKATIAHLPLAALGRYWPEGVADAARAWVEANVTGGELRAVELRLGGTLSGGDPWRFAPGALAGTLTFDGLTTRYLPAMSPLTGAAGTGVFTGRALTLHVARGQVAGLGLVRAIVEIPLAAYRPRIAIDLSLEGPLAKALALLDQEPLRWTRGFGVPPADVAGTVAARLVLGVPLGLSPTLAALAPRVSAHMRNVAVPRLPPGWALAGGDLRLEADREWLRLTGDVRLQGVPVTLSWSEALGARGPVGRQVDLAGRIDQAGRIALGLDQMPWLDGPVDAKVHYAAPGVGVATLGLALDLTAATIDMRTLDLVKPAGEPGRALVDLTLAGRAVTAVDRFEIRAGASTVSGRATRSSDGARWRTIDARALVAPRAPTDQPGHFTLAVRPEGHASRFTLTSDDAGALFRALGPYSDAEGGRLGFAGTVDLAAPALPLDGRLDVHDFTLTRQPTLARLATLASASGVANSLTGGGIVFERLEADLSHRDGTITIRNGTASGPSLGLSVRGTIERTANTLALVGTLVPSYYGLNQLPGRIPLLGRLLTGARREGVHVVDFEMRGSAGAPQISVRPSSLAPGALRDLLRLLGR